MNRSRLHSLRNIAAALLACAGFVSCTQDELAEQGTPLPVGQYPLELTADGLQAVATPALPATRGTMDGDWDGVTNVRVKVNDNERAMKYKVDASEDKRTASLIPEVPLENDDTPFWWQSTAETKTVTAWAPYEYVLGEWFDLPTKWEKDDFAKYDVIGVRKDIGFKDRNEPLEFRHLMAKVVINLRRTDYLENAQKVDVQLIGLIKTGRLAIISNQLRVSNKQEAGVNMIPYHLPAENYEEVDFGNGQREKPFASYTALVIPMNNGSTNVLQIDVDGTQYRVTKEALGIYGSFGVNYTVGQTTTINITVKENELDVTIDYTENISWDPNGNTGSGEVALP